MVTYHQYRGSILPNCIILPVYIYCCLKITLDITKHSANLGENSCYKTSKILSAAMLSCVKDLYANRVDGVY